MSPDPVPISNAVVEPPAGIVPARLPEEGTVVVRVPNWVGDAIMAMPALAALVDRFREHAVVVVARPHIAPLFSSFEGVTRVVRTGRGWLRFAQARKALAGVAPALGVVFPHSLGAAGELAAGGVAELWGYGGWTRRLAIDTALPRRWIAGRHRWETFARLAAAVTGEPVRERYPVPVGSGDAAAADALFEELAGGEPVVGLVPSAHATSRRWPAERFAELATRLGSAGATVVVFGTEAEREVTAPVVAAANPTPIDWTGRTTLPVLAACFQRLAYVVTNDTGPMHLAAAMGTPLLDICGAANEVVTAPRGSETRVIVHPTHCRPCTKNVCAYNLECLRGITVEHVAGALLGTAASPAGVR